jgi:hypothetical protein
MSILCKQKRKPFSYIDPCLYAICLFLLRSSVSGSPNSDCYLFHNFIPNAIFQQNSHVCGLNVCNLQQELIRTPSIQYWGLFCRDFLTFIPTYLLHVLHFFPWIGRGKSFSSTKIKHTVLNSKNDMIPGRSAHDCNPTVTQLPLAHTQSRHFVERRRVPEVPWLHQDMTSGVAIRTAGFVTWIRGIGAAEKCSERLDGAHIS